MLEYIYLKRSIFRQGWTNNLLAKLSECLVGQVAIDHEFLVSHDLMSKEMSSSKTSFLGKHSLCERT